MNIIFYILGIISGLLSGILILLSISYFKTPVERTINTLSSRLKQKGSVLEPEEELTSWIDNLKKE